MGGYSRKRLPSTPRFVKVYLGTTAASVHGLGLMPKMTLNGTGGDTGLEIIRNTTPGNTPGGGPLLLCSTRGLSNLDYAILQNGDGLGAIHFEGADGVTLQRGATVAAQVDGVPAAGDMPGRLVFFTTPAGAVTPAERLRIGKEGLIQPGADNTQDLGTTVLRFKDGHFSGTLQFGAYVATPGAITGYITVTDAAGNTRKLAVSA